LETGLEINIENIFLKLFYPDVDNNDTTTDKRIGDEKIKLHAALTEVPGISFDEFDFMNKELILKRTKGFNKFQVNNKVRLFSSKDTINCSQDIISKINSDNNAISLTNRTSGQYDMIENMDENITICLKYF
jgi:hypothetical protein